MHVSNELRLEGIHIHTFDVSLNRNGFTSCICTRFFRKVIALPFTKDSLVKSESLGSRVSSATDGISLNHGLKIRSRGEFRRFTLNIILFRARIS